MSYAKIKSCGVFDMQTAFPGMSVTPGRTTRTYELELIDECTGKAFVRDREYKLYLDTIMFFPPGVFRRSTPGFRCRFVHFHMDEKSKYAAALKNAPTVFGIIDTAAYRETFSSLIRHVSLSHGNIDSDYADAKMTELLYMLASDADKNRLFADAKAGKKYQSSLIRDVSAFLKAHFADKITLGQLSKRFFYSPNYIRTAFETATGESPREFLTRVRLDEARLLLAEGRLSSEEIADKCGFSSQSYFIALFKKRYGCTPDLFRRRFSAAVNGIFTNSGT